MFYLQKKWWDPNVFYVSLLFGFNKLFSQCSIHGSVGFKFIPRRHWTKVVTRHDELTWQYTAHMLCDVVTCWVCWRPHTTEPRAAARCCAAVHGALLRPPPRHTSRDTPSGHRRHCCGLLLRPWRCEDHTFTTVHSLNWHHEGVVKVLQSNFIGTFSHWPPSGFPLSLVSVPLRHFGCSCSTYTHDLHVQSLYCWLM